MKSESPKPGSFHGAEASAPGSAVAVEDDAAALDVVLLADAGNGDGMAPKASSNSLSLLLLLLLLNHLDRAWTRDPGRRGSAALLLTVLPWWEASTPDPGDSRDPRDARCCAVVTEEQKMEEEEEEGEEEEEEELRRSRRNGIRLRLGILPTPVPGKRRRVAGSICSHPCLLEDGWAKATKKRMDGWTDGWIVTVGGARVKERGREKKWIKNPGLSSLSSL